VEGTQEQDRRPLDIRDLQLKLKEKIIYIMSVKGATKDVHDREGGGDGGECDGSGASIPGASLNLINSITGAAIVAIPHAIQQCGLCLGMFLLVFLAYGIHQIITVLMECAIRAGELNLEDLTEHHFGTRGMSYIHS
jgi:hypothetical protein